MKQRRRTRLALAVAAALGVGLIGWAGTAEANDEFVDPHYYSDYDLNHDGLIDHFERDLMHYDRDGDARLDPIERQDLERHLSHMLDDRSVGPYYRGLHARPYARADHPLDIDGDGFVERWERRRAYRGTAIRRHPYDLDRDRVIEPWERSRRGRYGGYLHFRW